MAYTGNENNIGGQSHKITLYTTTTDDNSEIEYNIDSSQNTDLETGKNNLEHYAEHGIVEQNNIEQKDNIKNSIEQDYIEQNNDVRIALPTQMPNDTVKTQSDNDNVQRNSTDKSTSEDYYISTSNNIFGYPAKYFWGVIAYLWLFGVVAIMGYALVGYIHMKQITAVSMKLKDTIISEITISRFKINLENVYICDRLDTAFIFGIIHPRIYLPGNLKESQIENIIAHEHVHIMRRDYIWKLIGFLMLAVYWFNPLVWLAYAFLCRDIEFACDEQVISGMNTDEVKRYSETLLYCSTNLHFMYGCPLAFGEIAVKDRVKAVLNYKKPLFWVILLVFVLLITAGIFFFAKPSGKKVEPENDKTQEGENIVRNENTVTADEITPEPQIVETIEEGGKTYYKLSDGTYKYGYNTYKYRLEISGRSYGNDFDTVLIYLSNDEDIPFQRAEINTGMLSSSSQYIPKYEAVFIDHYTLKDTDDDIKDSMKDFLEQFTTEHLLDSFTQSDNSAVAEFAAQYLVKKNETDIIKDDTAHVYRIPNELFDSFIEEKFYLEQEPVINLVRQKRNQQTLLDMYFIPPMTCPLVIDWVKTDGNGKYYISGRNVYKDKRVEELKYIANSKEPLDGPIRFPLLDFSAIVIDTGEDETHNWKLYEWIVNP